MRLTRAVVALCWFIAAGGSVALWGGASPQIHTSGNTLNIPTCNGASEALRFTGSQFACGSISGGGGGAALPAGAIVMVDTGACPAGTAEVSDLSGRTLVGTLAAAGDVGSVGGSDTLTPAGTNSAPSLTMDSYTPAGTNSGAGVSAHAGANVTSVFTGAALATHSHELPFQKVAGGTGVLRMIASSVFGVGTSRAAESQSAAPVANTTATAVLKDQPLSAGTPAGTIANTVTQASAHTVTNPTFSGTPAVLTGAVGAPTFTGQAGENRSAFRRVIFCKAS